MKRVSSWSGLSLFTILLAYGVSHADAKQGSEARSVPAFHAIELAGTLEVDVTVGKPASVQISGDADMLGKVLTTVKDGVLVIDTDRDLHRRHLHLRATVTTPDLTAVTLSGTGGMKVTGVANESIALSLPGTGAMTLAGSTGTLRIVVDGTGQIAAKDLAAKAAMVEVSGTGQATLRVTESLIAKVTGTGSIDVHGHPTSVKKSVSGVGSIRIH
jgi:hypothetical protein